MPNALATFALILWPLAAAFAFRALPMGRAIVFCVLVAYLFLPPPPAGFDFPLLPPLDKDTIPNLVLVAFVLIASRGRIAWWPTSRMARLLVVAFVLSPLTTVLTNPDPAFYGRVGLPGLRLREAFALCLQQALFITPFLLARHYLSREGDQRDILWALFIAGLAYSLPMLVEIRLSPQLNNWIYGYYQANFSQTIRFGGYRPVVFLYHGIWVAFFAMTAALAAVALARGETRGRRQIAFAALYLLAVLILSKSTGAIIYALALVPLIAFLSRRLQLAAAVVLAALALGYPALKRADLVPQDRMVAAAEILDAERANSLRFRFDQEDILLDRADERPLFGWGSWGRNHILDPVTGSIRTITDGRWIIVIGTFGWFGFLAEFGLLTLPIFLLWWRALRTGEPPGPWIGPMTLMLAVNAVDLIPNATITPITWLLAGATLGYAERFVPRRHTVIAPLRPVL